MHSQSCSFLSNKKQPTFNGSLPHNIGLLRNFSSKSFSKLDTSTCSGVHITPTNEVLNQKSTTASIMDIVYRFGDSSRNNLGQTASSGEIQIEKSRSTCKQLISNYTQMPFVSSHLVGGFVGSKSQLGRRPTHGFGVNMWDIIRDLVDIFGNTSAKIVEKGHNRKNPFISKKTPSVFKVASQESCTNMNKHSNLSNKSAKLKDASNCQKQSYAEVTKIKLDLSLRDKMTSVEISSKIDQEKSSRDCNNFKPSLSEHISLCSGNDNRNRIASVCSIESEESWIVFEYHEGDNISIGDDDCTGDGISIGDDACTGDDISIGDDDCTGDDISIGDEVGFQVGLINEESCIDNEYVSSGTSNSAKNEYVSSATSNSAKNEYISSATSNSAKNNNSSQKKVQFAEGKNLVEVHTMVVWNYAYRAARSGQWEMLARDAERFRSRIANTEAILSRVLDSAHREAVFQQRFAHSDSDR